MEVKNNVKIEVDESLLQEEVNDLPQNRLKKNQQWMEVENNIKM